MSTTGSTMSSEGYTVTTTGPPPKVTVDDLLKVLTAKPPPGGATFAKDGDNSVLATFPSTAKQEDILNYNPIPTIIPGYVISIAATGLTKRFTLTPDSGTMAPPSNPTVPYSPGDPPPAPAGYKSVAPELSQADALTQLETQLKTQAPTGSTTTKIPPGTVKLQFPSTALDATLDGFTPSLTTISGWKAKPQPPNYTEKSITYDVSKVGSTRKIRNGIQYAQTFITKIKDALVAFQDSLDMIKDGANMTDVDIPPDSNVAGLSTIRKTKKASGLTSGPSAVGGRRTRKARKVRKGRKGTRKN